VPSIGETAPRFSLPGTDGTEIREYQLSEHVSEGIVVLVFYPFDFSPVCTRELCAFRDAEFLRLTEGVDVLGISTDSAYAHRQFSSEHNLDFPLLSDNGGSVSRRYGVLKAQWKKHRRVSQRAVIAIDEDRTVQYRWANETMDDDFDVEVLTSLTSTLDVFADGRSAT
jgi:peroxiredoxin